MRNAVDEKQFVGDGYVCIHPHFLILSESKLAGSFGGLGFGAIQIDGLLGYSPYQIRYQQQWLLRVVYFFQRDTVLAECGQFPDCGGDPTVSY